MKVLNNRNDYYSHMRSNKPSLSNSAPYSRNNLNSVKEDSNSGVTMRSLEQQQRASQKTSSVVESSISYAEQLRASRAKSEKTALEKKRLQYSFKKISSLIVRSKNSVSARKAVQAAKREINRLKRLKGSGEYDEEEVQLAIDHAKAMEKVAKKKVKHLEQEEMVERHQGGFAAALEEIEKEKEDEEVEDPEEELEEEALLEEDDNWDVDDEYLPDSEIQYEMQMQSLEMAEQMQEMVAQVSENMPEVSMSMDDFMQELSDEMAQMMEDMDLTELAESTFAPDPNMTEDDLKMLKIKHRYKELKEIAEADKEYLKGIMEHEKAKTDGAAAGAMGGGTSSSPAAIFGVSSNPEVTVRVAMPGAAAGGDMVAPTISGGFDVSV